MGRLLSMSSEAMSSEVQSAVCVLWSAGAPPAELLSSLRAKGVSPRICTSAFAAMAEICSVGTIGAVPHAGAILLIAEPAHVRGKKALLTSCKRYAPWLRLWVFQHDAPAQLRPLEMAQIELDEPDEVSDSLPMTRSLVEPRDQFKAPVVRNQPPSLRLSGDGAVGAGLSESAASQSDEDGHTQDRLLTDEELSMLLSDELDLDD